ncbi:MAG: DUF1844 domain-containing protein [Candidatus Omnitrophica bacterium CG08_land_8_20_14_0_20_41_16]|uniref:DUF1844 domain-containing protein n=1 Tax=Candidatus Sherwoodlollariibacterium unditelluris TaxID=1974757 RepID=A0A2G9YJH7_9BACT|nr:MAG: hypothetical protein COX41_05865 [Candidatus Omnitrophica bacterium CG23_combo_of_CG06-09_8_20_14_all_41_10]PIS33591.1 MAG: DUF1844 domain-containing protein [Candidatus Omnitrophica bacterium CG08_land_8_20_14_0_20_41_16]
MEEEKKDFVPPKPDFSFFVTTLSLQASIALGQIANPATNKTEEDIVQAKFLIDTLGMLAEKTKGNLNIDESKLLENLLFDLRSVYLSKSKLPLDKKEKND